MKKAILVLIIVTLFSSCENQEVSNLKAMKNEFKTYLKNKAFANNTELKIFQLDAVSYDTLTENYLDTLRLIKINLKYKHFQKQSKTSLKLAKLKTQQARLYNEIGAKTLKNVIADDIKKYLEESERYVDSMKVCLKIDSLIRKRIRNRINPKPIYQAKFFIKATAKKNDKKENILDTINVYFNTQLKLIDLKIHV